VACNWRIRHKLMLGMGLVMAIMGLQLAGTLRGLASYRATMRIIDSKLVQLDQANKLREAISFPGLPADSEDAALETLVNELPDKIRLAKQALNDYHERLLASIGGGRDPDQGFREKELVEALKQRFEKLDRALLQNAEPHSNNGEANADQGQKAIHAAAKELLDTSEDLRRWIGDDMHARIKASKTDNKVSLGIVMSTSVLAVLMLAGLLRFFYRSVAHPIRDLERGVQRVAKGDFDHPIMIHSGDEIEDLAQAFNDMTGRLSHMYQDLARQVNERSRQLVRSERLAGVGFLAAGVAHEINNPLASIAFCSEALDRRLADLFEARPVDAGATAPATQDRDIVSKYLKIIQDEALRCKTITRKLLEFSRGGERRREPADVSELVQVVIDMVQTLPSYKGKEVVFDPAEKITAWVNGQEIQQVFLNLVVNALESMEEGGRLAISQRSGAGMVELVFADTGCGMTDEVLENIFEPFFTRSRTGKGTGLGLSISHRIITQHGGDIEATSGGPGHGSTFTVRLPLEQPANQQEEGTDNLDPEAEFLKLSNARRERKAA
jgi:two-component system NtrC family sensor kinase